jgi:hypothetical protein
MLTLRDPGDTILSRIRVGITGIDATEITGTDVTLRLRRLRKAYRKMEKKLQGIPNILIIDEAHIEENPVATLQKVSQYIEHPLNAKEVDRLAHSLSKEVIARTIHEANVNLERRGVFSEFDRVTHWHANHIRSHDYTHHWSSQDKRIISRIVRIHERIKHANHLKGHSGSAVHELPAAPE